MSNATVDYKAVLADLEARKKHIEAMIEGVKGFLAAGGPVSANGASGVIRPDEIPTHAFLGLSIADAAKKFLDMVKSKQSLSQIMQALERGGLPPAKYNTVYAVLRRRENQVGDLFRMGEDWALSEWYPNNPNIRKRAKPAKARDDATGQEKPVQRKHKKGQTTTADAVAKILKEAGSPLHIRDIHAKLSATGREVSENVLRDVLTRKDKRGRFMFLGKSLFTLPDKPESQQQN